MFGGSAFLCGTSLSNQATGLPKGLTLNSSGTITGSIDTGVSQGIYTVVVTATASKTSIVSATYTLLVTSTTPSLSGTTMDCLTVGAGKCIDKQNRLQ
ncbi:MAG: Ig domain-containing protein [Tropheryma whipplei]|uniref:Ig domain-containing protein n=1 Tax=Tropheryma whipplei TaxID=2039 RepID=UPI001F40FD57|nr:Ig domain-containing protein [Tropheryma whipplei]MCO8190721.1 Ig domain-containing protein [Tropheryma whipplei]